MTTFFGLPSQAEVLPDHRCPFSSWRAELRMWKDENNEGMENESYKTSVAKDLFWISIQNDSPHCVLLISSHISRWLRQLRMAPKLSRQLLGDKCETCETLANVCCVLCEKLLCSKMLLLLLLLRTQQVPLLHEWLSRLHLENNFQLQDTKSSRDVAW